jgi:hypothetical protein
LTNIQGLLEIFKSFKDIAEGIQISQEFKGISWNIQDFCGIFKVFFMNFPRVVV